MWVLPFENVVNIVQALHSDTLKVQNANILRTSNLDERKTDTAT